MRKLQQVRLSPVVLFLLPLLVLVPHLEVQAEQTALCTAKASGCQFTETVVLPRGEGEFVTVRHIVIGGSNRDIGKKIAEIARGAIRRPACEEPGSDLRQGSSFLHGAQLSHPLRADEGGGCRLWCRCGRRRRRLQFSPLQFRPSHLLFDDLFPGKCYGHGARPHRAEHGLFQRHVECDAGAETPSRGKGHLFRALCDGGLP